jgi:hypothetical protein
MSSQLPRRLVVEFKPGGVETRVLYRTRSAPRPGTAARRGEAAQLARAGLTEALRALDAGDVADLGTSGFQVREDVLGLPLTSSDSEKPMRKGAQRSWTR